MAKEPDAGFTFNFLKAHGTKAERFDTLKAEAQKKAENVFTATTEVQTVIVTIAPKKKMTVKEIADYYGVSYSTARRRLFDKGGAKNRGRGARYSTDAKYFERGFGDLPKKTVEQQQVVKKDLPYDAEIHYHTVCKILGYEDFAEMYDGNPALFATLCRGLYSNGVTHASINAVIQALGNFPNELETVITAVQKGEF